MEIIKKYFYVFIVLLIIVSGLGFLCHDVKAVKTAARVRVDIEGKKYEAVFWDNKSTAKLLKKMPFTYTMKELNGNEKYKYLNYNVPTNPKKVKKIKAGDIMLYGSDCIVIFYKDFKTSYSYTKIGKIKNTKGLKKAMKKDKVKVRFYKLKKK